MDIANIGAAATEVAAVHTSNLLSDIILPLVINGALLAYFFGALSQRIRMLEVDVNKLRDNFGALEERVRLSSIAMAEVKTSLMNLQHTVATAECPMIKVAKIKGESDPGCMRKRPSNA